MVHKVGTEASQAGGPGWGVHLCSAVPTRRWLRVGVPNLGLEFRTRDRSRALVIERGVPGCVWRGCSEPVRAEELVGWEPTPKIQGRTGI